MNKESTKAQAFVELLPEIYYRKIILKHKHRDICQWLLDDYALDFFSDVTDENGHKTVPLFGNYLRRYGNLKKAEESYKENIASKLNVEEEWWKDYVDENHKPIKPRSKTAASRSKPVASTETKAKAAQPRAEAEEANNDTVSASAFTVEKESTDIPTCNQNVSTQQPKPADPTRVVEVIGVNPKKPGVDYNNIDPFKGFEKKLF